MKNTPPNNTVLHTTHTKYWLSGEKAKHWRRDLSQTADGRAGDIFAAHKFPLAAHPPTPEQRQQLRDEYRLSSAVAPNTLFHFFTALHLSGFRLFPNQADAKNHKSAAILRDSALNAALKKHLGLTDDPAVTLYKALAPAPRGNNQNAAAMRAKLQKHFPHNPELTNFLHAAADHIATHNLWAPANTQNRYEAIVAAGKTIDLNLTLPPIPPYACPLLWEDTAKKFLQNADASEEGLEFAVHQLISLAAHIARRHKSKLTDADIKTVLLSDNASYNGLDWLFNKGIPLFAKPDAMIQAGLFIEGCPPKNMERLRAIAQALIVHGYPHEKHRSLFGGNIASAVSNYWKRLGELKDGIDAIKITTVPDIAQTLAHLEQKHPELADIAAEYAQAAAPIATLQALAAALIAGTQTAAAALAALMGETDSIAGKTEVETIERFNDQFEETKGLFIQLAEKLRTRHNHDKSDFQIARTAFPDLQFLLPKPKNAKQEDTARDDGTYLKRKLNRYRGAQVFSPDEINQELAKENTQRRHLQEARRAHWQRLKEAGHPSDFIAARTAAEQQRAESAKRKPIHPQPAQELACRNLLHRAANTVRRLGTAEARAAGAQLFTQHRVFAYPAAGKDHFTHGKGRLYVSPYANYDHTPLALGPAFTRDNMPTATRQFHKAFIAHAHTQQQNAATAEEERDAAMLAQTVYAIGCGGIRGAVAAELAAPDPTIIPPETMPLPLRQAIERDTVDAGQLTKIFNLYAVQINGLCARMTRRTVIVKSRLQHIGDKSLYYQPKNKDWRLSNPLHDEQGTIKGDSPLARGWRLLQTAPDALQLFTDDRKTVIRAAKLAAAADYLHKTLHPKTGDSDEESEKTFRACLRQLPHDYLYKNAEYPALAPRKEPKFPRPANDRDQLAGLWQLKNGGNTLTPVPLNKSHQNAYLRLTGTAAHKGWLDDVLTGKATLGDSSLIIEEEYAQKYANGVATAEYTQTRLELAAAVKYPSGKANKNDKNEAKFSLADRFIAIDLGERGIGYAVFIVPKNGAPLPPPIARGHVTLPILRRLMAKVDHHRRQKQPRQRFHTNLNTALQSMREATIGELAGVIDALMHRYKAFPVFESTVGGFESGAKMLKMVYGSILHRYTYSDVDAHKAQRQQHWQAPGAPMWRHPHLRNPAKENKALTLFPGVMVGPAGTSQMCSHCEQNPLDIVDGLDKIAFPLKSDANGILTLPHPDGGEARLYDIDGKTTKNGKNPHHHPLPDLAKLGKNRAYLTKEELRKHIKKNLRHPPLAASSRDTSQSTYLSPFVAVQEELSRLDDIELKRRNRFRHNGFIYTHADINAAINIGRKWWKKLNPPPPKNPQK